MEIIDREPSSVIVCNDAATADVVKNFLISRDVGVVCVNEEIDWLEAQRLARLAFNSLNIFYPFCPFFAYQADVAPTARKLILRLSHSSRDLIKEAVPMTS